jgi:hypothetical protein
LDSSFPSLLTMVFGGGTAAVSRKCAFYAPRRAERTCAFHIEWLDWESFSVTGKLDGATAEGTEEDGNAMGEIEEEWGSDYHVKEAGMWCLLRLTVRVNIGWE